MVLLQIHSELNVCIVVRMRLDLALSHAISGVTFFRTQCRPIIVMLAIILFCTI